MYISVVISTVGQVLNVKPGLGHGGVPGPRSHTSVGARALSQGLCRDGWVSGSMTDFSGKDIPICFKVNPQPQTWLDAQASCRRDYGFLLKLDSRASIKNVDLMSSIIANGKLMYCSIVNGGISPLSCSKS